MIHEAKEGYGPICEFFGLPIPEEPYPRLNDTKERLKIASKRKQISFAIIFGTPVFIGTTLYFLLKYLEIHKQ